MYVLIYLSWSPNLLILTEKKNQHYQTDLWHRKIDFKNQLLVIFVISWSRERKSNLKKYLTSSIVRVKNQRLVDCATVCAKSEVILDLLTISSLFRRDSSSFSFVGWSSTCNCSADKQAGLVDPFRSPGNNQENSWSAAFSTVDQRISYPAMFCLLALLI